MDEIQKKAEELSLEIKSAKEASEQAKHELKEMKARGDATDTEIKAAKAQIEKSEADIKSLGEAINMLNTQMEALEAQTVEKKTGQTIHDEICELLGGAEFKSALSSNKSKNNQWSEIFELKASTADIVTPVMNTQMQPGVQWTRQRKLSVIPNMVQASVGTDKNRIAYISGKYASAVNYINEGEANTKEDTVSATEKYRQLAKISAKMKVTTEMLEDTSYIANQLETQMREKSMLFLDREAYAGDGDDATKPYHIYGLWGAATDFSATKAGVAGAIETPHVGDLVGAIKLQGSVIDATDETKKDDGGYTIDTVLINPVDAMKWRHTKTKDGNYVLTTLTDGSQVMGGVRVEESAVADPNTMLAMESGVAQFFIKRNMEIKVGQEEDDLTTDRYTIVLFMRAQNLVYENDKLGIIRVPDITAALASIAKPEA